MEKKRGKVRERERARRETARGSRHGPPKRRMAQASGTRARVRHQKVLQISGDQNLGGMAKKNARIIV
jgi:hypothetical protein